MRLQPKLRFKEFSGDWEEKKLGEICIMTSSKRVYLSDYVKNGVPFYRGKEISELKANKKPTDILYITEERYKDYKTKYGVPSKNDILITAVGTLGNIYRIKDDSEFYFKDGNLIWFKKITENSKFIEMLIQWHKKELIKTSIGSTQKALTMVELRKIKLPYPCLEEQKKIASFLSSIDEQIGGIERKKELMEDYKKSVMQKIFSKEKRFKSENGKEYPDWKEKRLGEISQLSKGKNISKSDVSEEGIECIRYGELYTNYSETIKIISSKTNIPKEKLILSEKGYVLIPSSGETAIDLATASCILKDGIAIGGDINIIKSKENGIFLAYYLNNAKKINIASLAQGSSVVHIYNSHLKSLKINLPSLPEQEKIANFLSSIDEQIEGFGEKIKRNKKFKDGLLQKMFV